VVASERQIDIPAELIARSLTPEQREEAIKNDLYVMSVTVTGVKPRVPLSG
jgi:hypothetical protein